MARKKRRRRRRRKRYRTIHHAARPGVRSPTVKPFLGSQDLLNRGQQEADWLREITELSSAWTEQKANTQFGLKQLAQEQERQGSSITDDAIGRGIFRSTVREGALADLTADIGLRSDALKSAAKAAEDRLRVRQHQIATIERPQFQNAQNAAAVENARELNSNSPWLKDPVAAYDERVAAGGGKKGKKKPKKGKRRPSRERRILTKWRTTGRKKGRPQRRANLARRRLNAARRRRRRRGHRDPNRAYTPQADPNPGGIQSNNPAGRN